MKPPNSLGDANLKRPVPPPARGEIWLISLDPTTGSEIKKTRPCVIVSSDGVGRLPVKLMVPLTEWNAFAKDALWMVRVDPDSQNGLQKIVVADTLQMRAVDTARCSRKIGSLPADVMEEIAVAIALVVEAT